MGQFKRQELLPCCAGSLIDNDAYAFNYNKKQTKQPVLGVIVLIDKEPRLVRRWNLINTKDGME